MRESLSALAGAIAIAIAGTACSTQPSAGELPDDVARAIERTDDVGTGGSDEAAFMALVSASPFRDILTEVFGSDAAVLSAGIDTCQDLLHGRPLKHAAVLETTTSPEAADSLVFASVRAICPSAEFVSTAPMGMHMSVLLSGLEDGSVTEAEFLEILPTAQWKDTTESRRREYQAVWDEYFDDLYPEQRHRSCQNIVAWSDAATAELLPTPYGAQVDEAMGRHLEAFRAFGQACVDEPNIDAVAAYELFQIADSAANDLIDVLPQELSTGVLEYPSPMKLGGELLPPKNYTPPPSSLETGTKEDRETYDFDGVRYDVGEIIDIRDDDRGMVLTFDRWSIYLHGEWQDANALQQEPEESLTTDWPFQNQATKVRKFAIAEDADFSVLDDRLASCSDPGPHPQYRNVSAGEFQQSALEWDGWASLKYSLDGLVIGVRLQAGC